jgi:hypothetical protein
MTTNNNLYSLRPLRVLCGLRVKIISRKARKVKTQSTLSDMMSSIEAYDNKQQLI